MWWTVPAAWSIYPTFVVHFVDVHGVELHNSIPSQSNCPILSGLSVYLVVQLNRDRVHCNSVTVSLTQPVISDHLQKTDNNRSEAYRPPWYSTTRVIVFIRTPKQLLTLPSEITHRQIVNHTLTMCSQWALFTHIHQSPPYSHKTNLSYWKW